MEKLNIHTIINKLNKNMFDIIQISL